MRAVLVKPKTWMVAALAAVAMQSPPPSIDVATVRFLRGSKTLIDGFVEVPYAMLQSAGAGRKAYYRVSIDVRDSTGTALLQSGWTDSVAEAMLKVAGVSAVQHFAFAAPSGRYAVDVTVKDSASGHSSHVGSVLKTFGERPRASDLLVTGAMRQAGSDTAPGPGEIRKGSVFLAGATIPALTPQQSKLFYYIELYPGAEAMVPVVARVVGQDGKQVIATPASPSHVGAGGGVVTNGLDLTGLPPGDYRLTLEMTFPDSSVSRSAAFHMGGFETDRAVAQATSTGTAGGQDKYARLTEAELDTLAAPLVQIMDRDERGVYDGLSVEGKRNFLRAFWAKRAPSPGTAVNEAELDFYQRIQESNRRYREGGAAGIPGWRTDRGRIFIRYGDPDETLKRPQAGSTPPYEVWKYTKQRSRKFVFLDETRFGNYALIYTDEMREPSRSNWMDLLGAEAVQDVQRF